MKVNKTIFSLMALMSVSSVSALNNSAQHLDVNAASSKSKGVEYHEENGTFYVDFPGYSIAVFEAPANGNTLKPTGQYLPHGTEWRVTRKALVNGKWFFEVGHKQWVQAAYMTAEQPEITVMSDLDGAMYVDYPNAAIAVFTSPSNSPKPTGQYLQHGTAWKVFQQATTSNGRHFIKVGEGQWVQGDYMSRTVPEIKSSNGLSGVMYVNYPNASIAVYTGPSNLPKPTGQYLQHGSDWQVFGEAITSNGRHFVKVGENQWVDANYMSWEQPVVQGPARTMVATAYDPRVLGNYTFGYDTVAANLNVFPRGTKLQITFQDGTTKNYVVRDTGGFAYNNPNQLDIAMPNAQAIQFGRQTITVRVIS